MDAESGGKVSVPATSRDKRVPYCTPVHTFITRTTVVTTHIAVTQLTTLSIFLRDIGLARSLKKLDAFIRNMFRSGAPQTKVLAASGEG